MVVANRGWRQQAEERAEESRIFYVAATRAQDDLYLCHPFSHHVRGKGTTFLRPSPFIAELEDHGEPELEPWERWMIDGG